jgi:hypothetical protein
MEKINELLDDIDLETKPPTDPFSYGRKVAVIGAGAFGTAMATGI